MFDYPALAAVTQNIDEGLMYLSPVYMGYALRPKHFVPSDKS
jgi:hypothetical protein